MAEYNFSQSAQLYVNLVLMWIGFATVVGLAVRSVLPGKEPSGLIGTVVIGILGCCIGPLALSSVWQLENFNPISPYGFCAAVVCAFVFLLLYRIFFLVFLRRKNKPRSES